MPRILASLLALLVALAANSGNAQATGPDLRQQRNATSPAWMFSVGRLLVPTRKWAGDGFEHARETCTASLVGPASGRVSSQIVTAWHCIEYYSDLSRPIHFELVDKHGQITRRQARTVAKGGGMSADWAVLSLDQPVRVNGQHLLRTAPQGRELMEARSAEITLAGYSGDPGLGRDGTRLTYQSGCSVKNSPLAGVAVDCIAHKGASGGPAVVTVRENGREVAYLAGIISQGDGIQTSLLISSERFHRAARLAY